MKKLSLIIWVLLVACTQQKSPSESEISTQTISLEEQQAFENMAQAYQTKYMMGSENLEDILAGFDEDIQMWENGKIWSYNDLVKYGPHLPKKRVVETYNDQKLLSDDLGYDYVSMIYISSAGDSLRETASRIWKKSEEKWKIITMNNLINREN
jgi:hypothetical protein